MTFNKKLLAATLVTAGGFAAMSSAHASGTESSDFNITTTIESVCTIDASGAAISFTEIAAGTTSSTVSNNQAAGSISVQCSKGAPYVINLTTLGNPTSTTGEGKMVGNTAGNNDTLTYQLNSTAEGKAWGSTGALGDDPLVGAGVYGTGTGVSAPLTHNVYATLVGSTDIKQDTYEDTITASITF